MRVVRGAQDLADGRYLRAKEKDSVQVAEYFGFEIVNAQEGNCRDMTERSRRSRGS